jgi:hypothetical protein
MGTPGTARNSVGLSHSIALRDLYNHPNLRRMTVDGDGFTAENIRGEQFREAYPLASIQDTKRFSTANLSLGTRNITGLTLREVLVLTSTLYKVVIINRN